MHNYTCSLKMHCTEAIQKRLNSRAPTHTAQLTHQLIPQVLSWGSSTIPLSILSLRNNSNSEYPESNIGNLYSYQYQPYRYLGVVDHLLEVKVISSNHNIWETYFPCRVPITAIFFWDYFSLLQLWKIA